MLKTQPIFISHPYYIGCWTCSCGRCSCGVGRGTCRCVRCSCGTRRWTCSCGSCNRGVGCGTWTCSCVSCSRGVGRGSCIIVQITNKEVSQWATNSLFMIQLFAAYNIIFAVVGVALVGPDIGFNFIHYHTHCYCFHYCFHHYYGLLLH